MADAPIPAEEALNLLQDMWNTLSRLEQGKSVRVTPSDMRRYSTALAFVEAVATPSPPVAAPPAMPYKHVEPTCEDAALLWAEIHHLRAATQGPEGFATWQEAATAERVRRVKAERAAQPQPQPAQPLTADQEEALRLLFKDAMDWGRSYGQSLSMSDITIQDVSQGFADLAKRALTAPSTPTPPEVAP